jgi:hypothetical protein
MQDSACSNFLEKSVEIFYGMESYVLSLPEEHKGEMEGIITTHLFKLHSRLMGHMDALIVFLQTKQFYLDRDGPKKRKAEKYQDPLSIYGAI